MDDKREWYYLKNSKDENVISILTSIYCEIKSEKSIIIEHANNSCIIPNYSQATKNKNDLSYDLYRNSSNNFLANALNRTHTNVNYGGLNNRSIDEKDNLKNKMRMRKNSEDKGNLHNTLVYNENYKSPDLSYMTHNLLSPYSYRIDNDKSNINFNMLNMSNLNSKLNNSNFKQNITYDNLNNDFQYLNTADSFFDNKYIDENITGDQAEIIKKLKHKMNQVREDQEKLRKINEDIMRNKESKFN